MPESVAIDFNELGRLIAAELVGGVEAINSPDSGINTGGGKFHIATMRVRLGQTHEDLLQEDLLQEDISHEELSEEELPREKLPREELPREVLPREVLLEPEDTLPSARKKFLLSERYPLAEQGWMFELELAAGAAPVKLMLADKPPVSLPGRLQISAIDIFGHLSIDAIKGVNNNWANIFQKYNINTVLGLVKIKHEDLIKIVNNQNKKYPISLHTKSRLLNTVVPVIPASPLDQASIYSLLTQSAAELRNKIGVQRFSASASEQLSDLMALLYTVLDSRILKEYTLQQLRHITPSSK